MSKLSETERQALNNACARLRETNLGTKIGNVEDFLDINVLKTDANTVSAAINELFDKWANPLLNITIPPPGFFTLAADAEGNLWCYCNDETNPPVFEHDEDTGDLYLYIASEEGENSYKVHVGNYIAVKHLNDYYTKTEIDSKVTALEDELDTKSDNGHTHDDRYFTESEVTNKLNGKANSSHTHDDRYYTESEMDSKLNGKANSSHTHSISNITDLQSSLDNKASSNHTHDDRYYTEGEIDSKIISIEDELDTKASTNIATTNTDGLMSSADKTKLDSLSESGSSSTAILKQCQDIRSLSTKLNIGSAAYKEYIKTSADWFISPSGSDSNDGTSESSAFRTFAPLASKASAGDIVYVESGTYTNSTEITIPVSVSIYGNPDDLPIITSSVVDGWTLKITPSQDSTVNIENVYFKGNTSLSSRKLVEIRASSDAGTVKVNVQNCRFENAKTPYNGCGLIIVGLPSADSIGVVCDCLFINNTTTSYGHSGASCQYCNCYGSLKVYRCLFNNPTSGHNKFCGTTGQSISVHAYDSTCYASGEGACNKFLGAGDTCRLGYSELECE